MGKRMGKCARLTSNGLLSRVRGPRKKISGPESDIKE